jgi:hypothetical protein
MAGMHGKRRDPLPGWWPSRILLAIGIVSVVVILLGVLASFGPPPGLGESWPVAFGPLSIPSRIAIPIAALAGAVVGLIWMIRIFRGPSDEPPPWRYRDRVR